jgi:hypothetical protein
MASLIKNTSGQNLTFCMVNATTGAGLTGATVSVQCTIDGSIYTSTTGTVTEIGLGQYSFAPSQGQTNGTDVGFLFTATSGIPTNYDFHTDPGVMLTAGTGTNQISLSSGIVSANTTELAGQTVTAAAGVTFPASIASPTNITAGTITTTTNVTNAVTANVTQWGGHNVAATNVNGVPIVDLGYTLGTASAGVAGYVAPDMTLSNYVETGVSILAWMRILGSTAGGLLSGAGSGTEVFNAMNQSAGTKTRVSATVDSSGNRTAISYTFT